LLTGIYRLSLHDALPISAAVCRNPRRLRSSDAGGIGRSFHIVTGAQATLSSSRSAFVSWLPITNLALARPCLGTRSRVPGRKRRSEEHTSELQSRENLVC